SDDPSARERELVLREDVRKRRDRALLLDIDEVFDVCGCRRPEDHPTTFAAEGSHPRCGRLVDDGILLSGVIARLEHMFEDELSGSCSAARTGVGAALAAMAPGPGLATVVAAADPGGLDDFDLISMLGAAERLRSWADAIQLGAIRELARRR